MNKAILIGRVTKNIEYKTTQSGKPVSVFTLAVNRDYKNTNGEYDADFINCVAYDQKAETINKYVRKGDKFGVIGRISTRTYDKQDGSKGYITEVIVDGFEFLENKKDKPTETEAPLSNAGGNDFIELPANAGDDDLPF